MSPLLQYFRAMIGREGPLSIARYMADALGHPEHGYYRTRDPLGAAGDFTTAPEMSQMFGELIGLWCAVTWRQLGRPEALALVELGPGRGTLMADALRAAAAVPDFAAACRVHLVETSQPLIARQRETLAGYAPAWHEALAAVPRGPMIVLANEFFDALPIRQFVRTPTGWHERLVGLDAKSGGLRFVLCATEAAGETIPASVRRAPLGSLVEVSAARERIAAELGGRLAADGGAALLIDYGHAHSAPGETLQAVRRHRSHPVLEEPGTADLTAHVDFAALATAALAAGAAVHGPIEQGQLLIALGVEARAAALQRRASVEQAAAIEAGLRRLVEPGQMGRLFKAFALSHPELPPPAGFEGLGGAFRAPVPGVGAPLRRSA
jgi:NADH dehydrogenase [ubiquinone] 1 alpha subcomplex assembly factor 7